MTAKARVKKLRLSPKQSEFIRSTKRFRAFIGGRGSGKSYAMAADLILRAQSGRSYLLVAPTAQLAREGVVPALYDLGERLGVLRRAGGNPLTFHLINNARIVVRTGRNPDLLRGGSYSGAALDEAALLSPLVRDIVAATLREKGEPGWMTFGSTPKGRSNWLFGEVATGRQDTVMVQANSRDNPFVSEEQVDSLISLYDTHFRRQEVEGEFLDADEDLQVLPTGWVEAAMKRERDNPNPPSKLDTLGVDTARGGQARFTIAFRHAYRIPRIQAFPGSRASTSQLGASLILNALGGCRDSQVNIDISGGTGSGVFDILNELPNFKAVAVHFGAGTKATDLTGKYRFANQRARIYWALREAISPNHGINLSLPDNYELAAELTAVHWLMNGSGAIQLQPKEQVAKVLRRSPDLADAVALTTLSV